MLTNAPKSPTWISELIRNPPPVTPQDAGSRIVEFPYIYVFDGTSLTNATSPTGLNVPITADADFYLRRVFGVPFVASTIQFRQSSGKRYQSDLEKLPSSYALNQEIKFSGDSSIRFDLGTVNKLTSAGVPYAYIGWQGAKRMLLSVIPYDTPYAFKRLPATHNYSLSLDWVYSATTPTKKQTLLVQNYDFELHAIAITKTDNTVETLGKFAILLYDAYGNQTSNLPVQTQWINYALTLAGTTAYSDSTINTNVFPVPPLIYPRNSMIQFDVQSLNTGATINYTVSFIGFDRYPLGA